jgi:hypothetical protein
LEPIINLLSAYVNNTEISGTEFRDWAYDPYTAFCIRCAARCDASEMQWRSPGELAGGDPREWTPGRDADPADLFLAYCTAAFWSKVWSNRASELDSPYAYDGNRHKDAENATAERLPLVDAALDAGDWRKAMNLLLPVGAPGWAAYEDEPGRMLAFRADNCRGTASAWKRLLPQIMAALPGELRAVIKEGEEYRQRTAQVQANDFHFVTGHVGFAALAPEPAKEEDDLSEAWKELNRLFGSQHNG